MHLGRGEEQVSGDNVDSGFGDSGGQSRTQ